MKVINSVFRRESTGITVKFHQNWRSGLENSFVFTPPFLQQRNREIHYLRHVSPTLSLYLSMVVAVTDLLEDSKEICFVSTTKKVNPFSK